MRRKARIFPLLLLLWPVKAALAQPDVSAWEVLNTGLHDPKNFVRRQQAVTAIGSIGLTPEAVRLVEHGLRDDDPDVRQTAAAQLGQMKSMGSIPALKAALDDPSGQVAFTAARVLWELGDHSGEQIIQQVLTGEQKSSDGVVGGVVHDARKTMHDPKKMATMGVNEASGALLGPFSIGVIAAEQFLKDGGAPGRMLSASMMSQNCTPHNLELIEWSLRNDKNAAVRAAAAKGLGNCHNKEDIAELEGYLSDSHDALKFMAAASIIRLSALGPQPAKTLETRGPK